MGRRERGWESGGKGSVTLGVWNRALGGLSLRPVNLGAGWLGQDWSRFHLPELHLLFELGPITAFDVVYLDGIRCVEGEGPVLRGRDWSSTSTASGVLRRRGRC